jgi:LDH2 family malate/lactate/ureidoglycolate dehydrogenase
MSASFDRSAIETFAAAALTAVGVPESHAAIVAESLTVADQRGTHSHGLLRLPLYVGAIQSGGINANPNFQWKTDRGTVALLDADAALGQVAMHEAVQYVGRNIDAHGIVAVAVQDSTHFGAGSYWAETLSTRGCIVLLTSSTGASVTPYGGAERLLGTNPFTISAPSTADTPLTLDIATSRIAYGKVVAARNEGGVIPEGMAVDSTGAPTTDPDKALEGALLPFGEHKGSGLSVLLEAVSVILGSAAFAHEAVDIWDDPTSRMNTGHLLIALDANAFGGADAAGGRVAHLQQRVRNSGGQNARVFAPGDVEAAIAARSGSLVRVEDSTAAALEELARGLSLPFPASAAA